MRIRKDKLLAFNDFSGLGFHPQTSQVTQASPKVLMTPQGVLQSPLHLTQKINLTGKERRQMFHPDLTIRFSSLVATCFSSYRRRQQYCFDVCTCLLRRNFAPADVASASKAWRSRGTGRPVARRTEYQYALFHNISRNATLLIRHVLSILAK